MLKRYVQAEFIGQGEESTVAIPANVAFSWNAWEFSEGESSFLEILEWVDSVGLKGIWNRKLTI